MLLLDIVISNPWLIAIGIGLATLVLVLITNFSDLKLSRDYQQKKATEQESKARDSELQYQQQLHERHTKYMQDISDLNMKYFKENGDLKSGINNLAKEQFEKFKELELQGYTKLYAEQAVKEARRMLDQWKIIEEERIRRDAINRSMGVNLGKVTEHLLPFSEQFKQFNSKDARFIGSPIDLIVFDGIEDKKEAITIYFIEVKTGSGVLSQKQKKVRDAIQSQNVFWVAMDVVYDLDLDLKGLAEPDAEQSA